MKIKLMRAVRQKWAAAVSILLALIMLVVCLPEPLEAAAEEIRRSNEVTEEIEVEESDYTYEPDFSMDSVSTTPASKKEVYIEHEAENKRTEYEKHFYMSDGTFMSETYAQPIHYLAEDGKYKDIDNTFVEYTKDGVEKIRNAENSFTAEFTKEITQEDPLLSVSKGEYKLDMYYVQEQTNARAKGNDKKPAKAEISENNKYGAKKEKPKYKDKKLKESIKNEKLTSELRFDEVETGVDFEYKIENSSVKESIVVESRKDSYSYDFAIEAEKLYLELNDDGSITAYNGAGAEIYVIPAPYMFDGAGEYSQSVRYELNLIEEYKYTLSIVADSEWINDEQRVFPVTIDPTVEIEENEGNFNITQLIKDESDGTEYVVSSGSQQEKAKRLVVKYAHRTNKAVYVRELQFDIKGGIEVAGFKYISNFSDRVTWESTELPEEDIEYIGEPNEDQWTTQSIYFLEKDRGFVFRSIAENCENNINVEFQNFKVIEYYIAETGVESSYNPLSYDGGDYTVYVKPHSQTYTVEIPYLTLEAPSAQMSVVAYYNPGFSNVRKNLYATTYDYYGKDIKLNVEQYMIKQGEGEEAYYEYIDADGTVHNFIAVTENGKTVYKNSLGAYDPTSKIVTDNYGKTLMEFDDQGRLIKTYANDSDYIEIIYSVNNKITKIKNTIGEFKYQEIIFEYTDNKLSALKGSFGELFGAALLVEPRIRRYIQYADGERLEYLKDHNNNMIVKLSYDEVYQLTNIYNGYGIGHKVELTNHEETSESIVECIYEVYTNSSDQRGINAFDTFTNNTLIYNYNPAGTGYASTNYYAFNDDKTVTAQWSKQENPRYPHSVTQTIVEETEEKTITTTLTAQFDQKDNKKQELVGYSNLYEDRSIAVTQEYISKFRNPVLMSLLKNDIGFKGHLYYKAGDDQTDGKSIEAQFAGMYYMLLLDSESTEIGIKIDSIDETANVETFGIGEMVSETVTVVYKKAAEGYSAGDVVTTATTLQSETVTIVKNGKIVREEYKGVEKESQITEYFYNNKDLVSSVKTTIKKNNTIIEENVTSYTYLGNLVSEIVTNIDFKKYGETEAVIDKTYVETYEYDEIGNLVAYTTADGSEYIFTYVEYTRLGVMLPNDKSLNGNLLALYEYDNYGNLLAITDNKGSVAYFKDGNQFTGYHFGTTTYSYNFDDYGNISSIAKEGQTMLTYYESGGLLDREVYANGDTVEYSYNGGSHLLDTVTYSNGEDEQGLYNYDYNAFGDITDISFADVTKTYSQNANKTHFTETVTGAYNQATEEYGYNYSKTAKYDLNDYYVGTDYVIEGEQRNSTVAYKSYMQGTISSETDGQYITNYSYNDLNQVVGITKKIGANSIGGTSYTYDEDTGMLSTATIQNNTYNITYDSMGNITEVTLNDNAYLSYTYDSAGRLKTETNVKYGSNFIYTYDADNNIKTVLTQSLTDNILQVSQTYKYDEDMLTEILYSEETVEQVSSDANGNITEYDNYELTWAQGTKLDTVTVSSNLSSLLAPEQGTYKYSYDENGIRYKKEKIDNNGNVISTTRYYLDGATIIAEDRNGMLIQYYYDSTGVIGMNYNGTDFYYEKDMFGNIIKIKDVIGHVVAEYAYDAWGNCKITSEPVTYPISAINLAKNNPFRYRGYYMDTETGYYYLQTRYYDPDIRRFISSDSYDLIPTLAESGDLNMYAYCSNNPVMYTDPSGEFGVLLTLLISTAVGLVVNAGIEIGKQVYNDGNWNWDISQWNWWDIGKAALLGAASGFAYGLGGVAGGILKGSFSALNIFGHTLNVAQSVGLLFGTALISNFIAGMGAYALHVAGANGKFNIFKATSEGIGQMGKGGLSFLVGGMFVGSNIWNVGLGAKNSFISVVGRAVVKNINCFIPNYFFDNIF